MAGPSGPAFGPPKGRLVPAIRVFLCVSPARRGWPGQARPCQRTATASSAPLSQRLCDKPGHENLGETSPLAKRRPNLPAVCCSLAQRDTKICTRWSGSHPAMLRDGSAYPVVGPPWHGLRSAAADSPDDLSRSAAIFAALSADLA